MAKKKTIRTIPQERTPMREQDAQARAKNFEEVACGYNLEEALRESERCLMCPDQPCVSGCPVSIDIPGFIQKVNEKNLRGAYDILTDTNLLPSICGRVCPQENQCEGVCTVGDSLEAVAIGRLERFVGDTAIKEGWVNIPYIEPNRFRVGIVGSGPAGMACAADMAKAGCDVTVYEAFHQAGGVLKYGIPDFRLPNEVIDAEINNLKKLGVKFECNTLVGRLFTIEQMIDEMGFHAVFIGVGAGYPTMLNIPGDSSNGVLSANELLTRCNLMRARDFPNFDTPLPIGKRVAVVGAGNTAMDATRVSLRLGAEKVYCVYRRSRTEAPARAEEVHHAEQEGVEFHWLTAPVAVLGRRQGQRARHALRAHGIGRARRFRQAPPGAGRRQRIRFRDRSDRVCDRHQCEPDHGADVETQTEQMGLYRRRRQPGHLGGGRVRRRRHRHRRGNGDPGHGRGPQGGAQHEGLSRHPRSRTSLCRCGGRRDTVRHRRARAQFRARAHRLVAGNSAARSGATAKQQPRKRHE